MSEIIRYIGNEHCNDQHDGGFSVLPSTKNYQVTRCSRATNTSEIDKGTFNHSPMLAYFNNKFYVSYINNPISETVPPSRTLLKTSTDGEEWSSAIELFPSYKVFYKNFCTYANMHHRMGFFISSGRKLYGLGFYGISLMPDEFPNNGKGIGRVIREIKTNGKLGQIFFLRYNLHSGWNEQNTLFPHYLSSNDAEFIRDCEELLGNKLLTLNWWEEDRSTDGFYSIENGKGFNYYQISEEETIGLWKWGKASISYDKGLTWSPMTKQSSLITAGGKCWAEKITEGKYALIYNPTVNNTHRWPLVVTTSQDGKEFDDMYCLTDWVSPRKYYGLHKYFGPSYPSGLTPGSDTPPGGYTWVVYSMNKEDIWISKLCLSDQNLKSANHGGDEDWGVIKPKWGEIKKVNLPYTTFIAKNWDPYEDLLLRKWSRKKDKGRFIFDFFVNENNYKKVMIELVDNKSKSLISLLYFPNGNLVIKNDRHLDTVQYKVEKWESYIIEWNVNEGLVNIEIGSEKCSYEIANKKISGLVFKTQSDFGNVTKGTNLKCGDLENADYKVNQTSFSIRKFSESIEEEIMAN